MFTRKLLLTALILIAGLSIGTNAQSRLVPTNRHLDIQSKELRDYRTKFNDLLLSDIGDYVFAFTVAPSFFGESSCHYDNSTSEFVLKEAKDNIWYYYFGNNSKYQEGYSSEVEINEFRCKVPYDTARHFADLFFTAIFSSSYLSHDNNVLDGVTYELLFDRGYYSAQFVSPKEGTNCYNLEKILEKLCKAVKENDLGTINALVAQVKELSETFKKLFPEETNDLEIFMPTYDIRLQL